MNIRQYKYVDNYLVKIKVYETSYRNKLIVPVSNSFKLIAEIKYKYNAEGLLKKETMNNFLTGDRKSNKYEYNIETLK